MRRCVTQRISLQTLRLRECMLAHRDYYAPLLEEEEAEMEAARQAEAAGAAGSGDNKEEEEEDQVTESPLEK